MIRFLGAALLFSTACAGAQPFALSARDSEHTALAEVARLAAAPTRAQSSDHVYLVTDDQRLVAWSLLDSRKVWEVPAAVRSKVVAGVALAHADDRGNLVGRDAKSGQVLWTTSLDKGRVVGLAAADDLVLVTLLKKQPDRDTARAWELWALDGESGRVRWTRSSRGALGAPVARPGVVAVPLLSQWVVFLRTGNGEHLARVRSADEEVQFVTYRDGAFYMGSGQGLRRIDARARSGQRTDATYSALPLPASLSRVRYARDSFDPIQADYSALDRARALWQPMVDGTKLSFAGSRVAVVLEKYLFSLDGGRLRWARVLPGQVVTAHATASQGFFATRAGDIGAFDLGSGALSVLGSLGSQVRGATFPEHATAPLSDASGTAPTTEALAAMAKDRDARFVAIQSFAATALGDVAGPESVRALLSVVNEPRTTESVRKAAQDALAGRRDVAVVLPLIESLEQGPDFLTGFRPRTTAAAARALAGVAEAMTDTEKARAAAALETRLRDPQTQPADLPALVSALAVFPDAREALREFLLTYRADPEFKGAPQALLSAVDALAEGTAYDREVVAFVAHDPRTLPALSKAARRHLYK